LSWVVIRAADRSSQLSSTSTTKLVVVVKAREDVCELLVMRSVSLESEETRKLALGGYIVGVRILDLDVIFCGLLDGTLNPDQASALFREEEGAARYYLNDKLGETLRQSAYRTTTDLDCPAGRLLTLYWKIFGVNQSVLMFTLHDIPLVECFLKARLQDSLEQFSQDDLALLYRRYDSKPMAQVVMKARARHLIPIANVLLRNPAELNSDISSVKARVSAYCFSPELNEVLDKVEREMAGGDGFDQAAILKHLRTFYEKLHEQVALKLQAAKPETRNGTDLTKCGHAIDYLQQKGVLTDKVQALGRSIYGVLCSEGVHSLKTDPEYSRLCRNMIAEYAMILFFELERRLQM